MNIVKTYEDYKRDIKEKVLWLFLQYAIMSRDGKRGSAFWRGSRDLNIQLNEDTWYDHARGEHKTWGASYVGLARLLYNAGFWPYDDPSPPRVLKCSNPRRPKSPNPATAKHTSTSKKFLHWYSNHLRVVRIEKGDGSKLVYPQHKIHGVWKKGLPANMIGKNASRPLYNLEQLLTDRSKPVLVVEGEKMVDLLKPKLTQYVLVSWLGGSGTAKYTDWWAIADHKREFYLCPDNDDPGRLAMDDIGQILSEVCPNNPLYVVDTSGIKKQGQLNNGGDLVDLEVSEVADFIHVNARAFESDKFARYYQDVWPDRAAARFGRYMSTEGRGLRFNFFTRQVQIWCDPCWVDISKKLLIEDYLCGHFRRTKVRQLTDDIKDSQECTKYATIHHKGFPQSILSWLLSLIGVDEFPKPPGYELACAQGILDLRCGEVRSARMETDSHTLMICGQYEVERTDADDRLRGLIKQWIPDPSELLWLRLALGEALHGRATDSQHFLCVLGAPKTGKSTLFSALLPGALGGLVKTGIDLSELSDPVRSTDHNTALAEIIRDNPRIITTAEIGGKKLPPRTIKCITGGDPIRARRTYGTRYEQGIVSGLLICFGNNAPRFSAESGLNRRLRVLRMDNVVAPSKRDQSIQTQLKDPSSALSKAALRWLVDCATDYWVKTQGGTRPLPEPPDSMLGYKREMLCRADVIYEIVSGIRVQEGSLIGLTSQEIKNHHIAAHRLDDYNIRAIGHWLNDNGYVIKQKRVGAGERRYEVVSEPELWE